MPDQRPHVYTAGAISWMHEHYAGWRAEVDNAVDEVTFFHPTETYNEYDGHRRAGCVTEDIDMVERSDGVVALISKPEQIGTVTEVVHAVTLGTPVLLLIAPNQWEYDQEQDFPYEIDTSLKYHSSEYWFLVNYLLGDQDVALPDGRTIPGWEGYDRSSAWVTTRDSIVEVVNKWLSQSGVL